MRSAYGPPCRSPPALSTRRSGVAILSSSPVRRGHGSSPPGEPVNEDVFNIEIRKFLKRFGITSQREIEKAVEAALNEGRLRGNEVVPVHATLTIPGVLENLRIDGEIDLR